MDIDFLTHFIQLAHGAQYLQLRSTSTRFVLNEAMKLELLTEKVAQLLTQAYDFYKKSELALRVFDMKSISDVNKNTESLLPLAKALGFLDSDENKAVAAYQDKLMLYRNEVRCLFDSIISAAMK